jgi:hypothetical protein
MLRARERIMKRFLKVATFSCVTLAMFATLLLKVGVADAAPLRGLSPHSPNAGARPFQMLNGIAEVSAHNLWL